MRTFTAHSKPGLIIYCAGFLLLCSSSNASAQKSKSPPATTSVAKPTAFCRKNTTAFPKIRLLIEKSKRFQDLESRIRGVAELSFLLWQCDSSGAEAFFEELHQMLRNEIAKRQPTSKLPRAYSATKAESDSEQPTLAKLRYLNGYLLSFIYRRNPELAKRLASSDEVGWDEVSYDTVKGLLDSGDTKKAAAELRNSIDSGLAYGIASQLLRLRQVDPTTADSLFLAYLDNLTHRSQSAEEVMQAGVYLFVGNVPLADYPGLLEMSFQDHTPVPRFVTRQPGATDITIRAYLGLVSMLLSQPVEDLKEKKARYALGRVLLMQVPQNETELMAAFQRGLQKLAIEVTDSLKNDQIYQSMSSSANESLNNLDQQLEGIQKIPSTDKRDELCIMLANSLYSRKHPADALRVVGLMSLSKTRSQLETTIMSAIAFDLLKHEQLLGARQMTEKIAAGPERSLLLLKLAEAFREGNDADVAAQLMAQAIGDARKADGAERGLLLIKAAGVVMDQDLLFAKQLLLEATDSINTTERWRAPLWETGVVAHGAILRFRFGGAEGISFTPLIEPLVKKDPNQMEVFIGSLKSEKLQVEGFVLLGKYLIADGTLKEKSKPKG
jgi:hypothetical protein